MLTVTGCTITDNRSEGYFESTRTVKGGVGILVNNGTAIVRNTIVADNYAGSGASQIELDIDATLPIDSASSYNLVGTVGSGGLVDGVNNNQIGVADPGLAPLAFNGGPTQTHALLPGSPAIDMGKNFATLENGDTRSH